MAKGTETTDDVVTAWTGPRAIGSETVSYGGAEQAAALLGLGALGAGLTATAAGITWIAKGKRAQRSKTLTIGAGLAWLVLAGIYRTAVEEI